MTNKSEDLLKILKDSNKASRLEAVKALAELTQSNDEIVRALERVVITDSSEQVQEMALSALALPIHQHIHRRLDVSLLNENSRFTLLRYINYWASEGLLTPQVTTLLRGRCALHPLPIAPKPEVIPEESSVLTPQPPPQKQEAVMSRKADTAALPAKMPRTSFDGEIAVDDGAAEIEQPFLEKQKFSLIGTLTSEITIKIMLYLGAFLIVAAAVVFAGLVEVARFPMLTATLLGFLTAAGVTRQRLALGSFVLFVIGTLLIPIDAAIFFALINTQASLLYWAVVAAGVSLVWAGGTYFYESRFFSLLVFATFSIAVYLVAVSYIDIDSTTFLLVVSLVAVAGLAEAALLRSWQPDDFFIPMFGAAQLQMAGVLGMLGMMLVSQMGNLLAYIGDVGSLSDFDPPLPGAWLTAGVFYFASDHLIRRMKKWDARPFRFLVTGCLLVIPIFIIEALSADPHQIAAVLWGWGLLAVIAAEACSLVTMRWVQTYATLFLYTSILLLMAAPVVEYVTTPEYAIGYFLATSALYGLVTYWHKDPVFWNITLVTAYLAYLVGVKTLSTGTSPISQGFALLIPALTFLSGELAGRRYFRAAPVWTTPLIGLGLINLIWDVGLLLSWYENHPDSVAIIFFIYGIFGAVYAALDDQRERDQAALAWIAGLISLYVSYIYLLPNVNDIDFGGYMLLVPAMAFLAAALVGKHYFQASPFWTRPLLFFGLFNVTLDVWVTFLRGADNHPGSAAIIFLIYGLCGVLYATLITRSEREYAIAAWAGGWIALYAAYGFVCLWVLEPLNLVEQSYALLVPALVFLSAELVGKLYFRASQAWTLPLLELGIFNAILVVPATLVASLDNAPGNAVIIFLIYGLFAVLYAALTARSERDFAIPAWTIGLLALYTAYGFVCLWVLEPLNSVEQSFALLVPALVFLSAELAGKLYFRASRVWTLPLLGLGIFNAILVVPVTLLDGLDHASVIPVIIFLIYGLFAVLYAALTARSERDYAVSAWTIGLVALYAAYGFICVLPAVERLDIFPGYVFLAPALVFLSAELAGKLYFRASRAWTQPLLGLGIFNTVLLVPVTLLDRPDDSPGSVVIIFLVYGLFGVLYAALTARTERQYAVNAWTVGVFALYAAYGFSYALPAINRLDIFPGLALLVPAVIFLSAELAGKLYFRASPVWTQPLLGLGIFNTALVVPISLMGGLENNPGSAAITFLIFGLFIAIYTVLNARAELGYVATTTIGIALFFALTHYDQQEVVLPFIGLTLLYYLGGLAVDLFYQRHGWSQVLQWSGLVLGTLIALYAPFQPSGGAVVGMGVVATLYGVEAFRRRDIWFGLPANGLFLGAYFLGLQLLEVTEPQFYSIGTALLAILTHYLLTRRSDQQAAFAIGFVTGWIAQLILLGTSFIQMSAGLQFFFILFFQSLILLGYGLLTRSLSFTIVPILFLVGAVLRVVFTTLARYSTVVTLGCTGLALILLGITALVMRERLLKAYEDFQQLETLET